MRVAMVIGSGEDPAADAGRAHVEGLTRALGSSSHDIRVFANDSAAGAGDGSLAVLRPSWSPTAGEDVLSTSRKFGGWLAGQWADWKPDVVHAHFYTSGLAALVASNEVRVPLIVTFHSLSPVVRGGRARAAPADVQRLSYERLVGAKADAIIVQSVDEVQSLVSLRVRREAIALVPDAVDDRVYRPEGESARRSPGRHRLLSVGPLDAVGGHGDAIRALRYIPDAELVIIGASGSDPFEDDPYVTLLTRVAKDAGVADRVRLAGQMPPEAMPPWYRSAAVLLCAGRTGASGKPVIEAMACGVPAIAYDVPVLHDIVVDGVTGELTAPGDYRGLGVAAYRLLGQDFRRMQYAVSAADRARFCFSWARATDQVVEVYERVSR